MKLTCWSQKWLTNNSSGLFPEIKTLELLWISKRMDWKSFACKTQGIGFACKTIIMIHNIFMLKQVEPSFAM